MPHMSTKTYGEHVNIHRLDNKKLICHREAARLAATVSVVETCNLVLGSLEVIGNSNGTIGKACVRFPIRIPQQRYPSSLAVSTQYTNMTPSHSATARRQEQPRYAVVAW